MKFINLNPGKSVLGSKIQAFKTSKDAPKYTYLMAGVHGDEPEGVYILKELFTWLQSEQYNLYKDFIVIPILNVDGYKANTRVNANKVDLNRNYPSDQWTKDVREEKYYPGTSPLSEPENQFLDSLFKQYPPKFIVSLHSWKPFINYNGNCKEAAEFLSSYNGYEIVGEIIDGHPTPGSLGEYGPQVYQSPVLTFECPTINDSLSFKQIWEQNREAFMNFLQSDYI